MANQVMSSRDRDTLVNICWVAAEKFQTNAELLRKHDGTGFMSKEGAQTLAEQFEQQTKDARRLGEMLVNAGEVTISEEVG